MTNPYKAPESEITPEIKKEGRRIGWMIFFVLMLILGISGFIDSGTNIANGDYKFVDISELLIYPFVLVALFGYAFKKRFLTRIVWKILLPLAVITDVFGIYQEKDLLLNAGTVALVAIIAIILLISVFQYMALYYYGYSDKAPWFKSDKG